VSRTYSSSAPIEFEDQLDTIIMDFSSNEVQISVENESGYFKEGTCFKK
jgi:hypothetical protein